MREMACFSEDIEMSIFTVGCLKTMKNKLKNRREKKTEEEASGDNLKESEKIVGMK